MKDEVTIVILAAGMGTRMKSRKAKVLHSAGGATLIGRSVETALTLAPAERIFVVVGHQAEAVRHSLAHTGVRFIEQTEQKGTGHALLCGRETLASLGGLLLVFYGDCPLIRPETLAALIEHAGKHRGGASMLTAKLADPSGYGRIVRSASGAVEGIVEHKAATPAQLAISEINAGVYCFAAEAFWRHIGQLSPDNPAGEYYLTDMVSILLGAGFPVYAQEVDFGELLGINNRVELAAADKILRDRKARELMLAGVTIERPETVTIDSSVQVGMDTVIEAFVQLRGRTVIGEDCRIGACSQVTDSHLGDSVEVGAFTIIGTSRLERGVHAGPFARLRLENHLAEGVHVGNFVELKKATFGPGSKANHLAYLGDTSIGSGTNVGAGTITCNYDGVNKNRTAIGSGVFVGSNSTLIAPLVLADRSYIAAGSVITHDVPEDALAFGRSRQVVKEGYARKSDKVKSPKP